MATDTPQSELNPKDRLAAVVRAWDRRLRWTRTVAWMPYALVPGITAGIMLAFISRATVFLNNSELILATAGLILAGFAAMLAFIWTRQRSLVETAQRVDYTLGLQERVSTALELGEGRIHTRHIELAERQQDDAFRRARQVSPVVSMPLKVPWRAWVLVAVLILPLVILLLLPNEAARADENQNAASRFVIEDAADEVGDIIEGIAADPDLDEATRERILQELQVNLETLQDEDVTPEEAIATLNDVQALLEEEAGQMEEDASSRAAQMQAAMNTLEDFQSESEGDTSGEDASGEAPTDPGVQSLEDFIRDFNEELAEDRREEAAQALEEAADALEGSNPEAAQSLRDAANAIREGDDAAADQALSEAADSVGDSLNETGEQQAASQGLRESAQNAQQAAQNVVRAAGQEPRPSGDTGPAPDANQGSQDGQQEANVLNEEAEPGQEGSPGDQQSLTDQSEQGQQAVDSPSGDNPGGETAGETGTGSEGMMQPDGETQGGSSDSLNNQNEGNATGSGETSGDMTQDTTGMDSGDLEGDIVEGAGEEREFEAIFDPRRFEEAQGDTDVQLEPDSGENPLQEVESSENPTGDVTVPYDEVFGDYSAAASEALDRGYVPLGLRDVIRNYFTSLAPTGSGGE